MVCDSCKCDKSLLGDVLGLFVCFGGVFLFALFHFTFFFLLKSSNIVGHPVLVCIYCELLLAYATLICKARAHTFLPSGN